MSAKPLVDDVAAPAAVNADDPLYGRMACPACARDSDRTVTGALRTDDRALVCEQCDARFPLVACGEQDIAWAFPSPDGARLEWNARLRGELQRIADEHNRLNRSMSDLQVSATARRRMRHEIGALRDHRQAMNDLLTPLGLDGDDVVPAITRSLDDKLPRSHGIASYAGNVFRDWSWNNGENEALFAAVETVLSADPRDSLGSVLTLGAGAGRLTYDLHRACEPELSVALDFNPLLLVIGAYAMQGRPVFFHEFPIAPLHEERFAVLQECVAPEPVGASGGMRFVLADATAPPFIDESFDTVVTSWLIDIIPQDLTEFLPQLNRLLPEGGLWVNTGSLAFFDRDPSRRYSEAEVREIVESNGFELLSVDHRTVPYLQSPHSAHGRTERIVSFAARKNGPSPARNRGHFLPGWLLDPSQPIPEGATSPVEASSQLLKAQVLAAIDGKRSIDAIAVMVSREYGLPLDECRHAVRRLLVDAHEADASYFSAW